MNNYPDDFNISSDYATISHTGSSSAQLNLPTGLTIPPNSIYIQKKEMPLASVGILRLIVSSSTNPNRKVTSSSMALMRNFRLPTGEVTPMTVMIVGWLQSSGTAVCSMSVSNVYNGVLTYVGATETFTVEARAMTFPY